MIHLLIDQYEQGGPMLRAAVQGLTREQLTAFPVPGTWSIHQVVLHLADSDLVIADRMKRVIAEDNPPLIGFDESRFVRELYYHDQSVEDALALFAVSRRQMARVLRRLPESAFARRGTHNQRGPMTLEQLLRGAIGHLEHHLKFLYEKKDKLG